MKQIEKFALEAITQVQADAGVRLDPVAQVTAAIFFEHGFRKAKEEIISLGLENSDQRYIRETIEQLGEYEIK